MGWKDNGAGAPGRAGPGSRCGLEDADVAIAFEVEEAGEGVGIGDAEVVAGEDAEAAPAVEEIAQVPFEAVDAARQDEADGDVGVVGLGEVLDEVGRSGSSSPPLTSRPFWSLVLGGSPPPR